MNTLLLTTPQARIAANAFRDLEPQNLTRWHVETVPSGSIGRIGNIPTVTVVQVGDQTRTAEAKALIRKLAHIQTGVPQGAFVLFALKRQAHPQLPQSAANDDGSWPFWRRLIRVWRIFKSERVDVIEYLPELLTKLSLIETKLKIAPPRPVLWIR